MCYGPPGIAQGALKNSGKCGPAANRRFLVLYSLEKMASMRERQWPSYAHATVTGLRPELHIGLPLLSYRPLFRRSLICKLLKTNWSGRVDSNHRPPGPEPGDSRFAGFCAGLLIFHITLVQLVSSMGCASPALHGYALSCGLWLHEKGKKRARFSGHRGTFQIIVPILGDCGGLWS